MAWECRQEGLGKSWQCVFSGLGDSNHCGSMKAMASAKAANEKLEMGWNNPVLIEQRQQQ
jgi:hypothetical protein